MAGTHLAIRMALALLIVSALSTQSGATVNEAWVARFDGTAHGEDEAWDIAVDASGYVYVAGKTESSGCGSDIALFKYDSDGNEVWAELYDGPYSADDLATALALAPDGGVVVAGSSRDSSGNFDYVTVKYDSNGAVEWDAFYGGPAGGEDYAYDVVCDEGGDIYVTGSSEGVGSNDDIATVKYGSGGEEQWVERYEGPVNGVDSGYELALGPTDDVYVVGRSMGGITSYDIVTVKYSPEGAERWVARYDGDIHSDDRGFAISVNENEVICVAGFSYGGEAPGTQLDCVTVQYDAGGNEEWVQKYDGPAGGYDFLYDAHIAADGSVLVTGGSAWSGIDISDFNYDVVTIKYDSLGDQVWLRRFNGEADGSDEARAMAVDESGSVYVTGSSDGRAAFYDDYLTLKYDSGGELLWAMRYNGPMDEHDYAHAIALDQEGSAYVTGGSNNAWDDRDIATVKYSPGSGGPQSPGSIAVISQLPHAGTVTFRMSGLEHAAHAKLTVFDLSGRLVKTVLNGPPPPTDRIKWDGCDDCGGRVSSGVYFARLEADGDVALCKSVILR